MTAVAKVAIVVGSSSDLPRVKEAYDVFIEAGVECAVDVLSAHRSPQLAEDYVLSAKAAGIDVIIAGAGLAAQLPGLLAPLTHIPVLGLPLTSSKSFSEGLDALLSITHMPPGVPLLSGGIDSAYNVALAVLRFIQYKDPKITKYLEATRQRLYQTAVIETNASIAKTATIKVKNEELKFSKPVLKLLSESVIESGQKPEIFDGH